MFEFVEESLGFFERFLGFLNVSIKLSKKNTDEIFIIFALFDRDFLNLLLIFPLQKF